MDEIEEEWRPIEGWEGTYEVSNLGRLKSLARLVSAKDYTYPIPERILVASPDRYGHVSINFPDGKRRSVHRLVAIAFNPNPNNYTDVRHWDGVPDNNVSTNLVWGTKSENMRDRRRHGTDPYVNRTHCPQDHEYTEENIYWEGRKRKCRQCRNRWAAEYRERERIKKEAKS